jgi:hypothetical protein
MNPESIYQTLKYKKILLCKKNKKKIPDLKPYISSLSQYSSPYNSYIKVYVTGENFLPNGLTRVDFGNIQNININYVNSNTLYFEVHNVAFPGVYNIFVKNTWNLNAKNPTASTINGLSIKSNVVQYTITH